VDTVVITRNRLPARHSDGERTLLCDLDMAIQRLNHDVPDHPSAVQLASVYHNLLRHWAEV
jgi:PKHD-type hydroxylase